MLDISGHNYHWQERGSKYVVVDLLGKIKREHHDIAHIMQCIPVTSSGINIRFSLARSVEEKANLDFKVELTISSSNNLLLSTQSDITGLILTLMLPKISQVICYKPWEKRLQSLAL